MGDPALFVQQAATLPGALHRAFYLYQDNELFGFRCPESASSTAPEAYRWLSYGDVWRWTVRLADGLRRLGVPRRAMAGICAPNVPQWMMADFACCLNDYSPVGLHLSWGAEKLAYILDETDMQLVFVSMAALPCISEALARSRSAAALDAMLVVVVVDGVPLESWLDAGDGATNITAPPLPQVPHTRGVVHLHELLLSSVAPLETLTGAGVDEPLSFWQYAGDGLRAPLENDHDLYTLMYTSGTTGSPKGVVVDKRRWKLDAQSGNFLGQATPVTMISYLALAHGGDRGLVWQATFQGYRVGFSLAASHDELMRDIATLRPTFLLGMSHFWARCHADYRLELHARVLPDLLPRILELLSTEQSPNNQSLAAMPRDELSALLAPLPIWNRIVDRYGLLSGISEDLMDHVREDWFGGRVSTQITGGAHTSKQVIDWMTAVFAPKTTTGADQSSRVRNSYGTTEFPGISVNGEINDDIELELVPVPEMGYFPTDKPHPRGEIRVRHKKNLFSTGYWRKPTESAKAFQDGWYLTGDIGLLDLDAPSENGRGRLHIIDRRNNMIELYVKGDSLWIEPGRLEENVYRGTPGVEQVVLFGDRNIGMLVAVVVPTAKFLAAHDGRASSPEACRAMLARLQDQGRACGVAAHELPAAVILETERWTFANGGLSAIGKVARAELKIRYLPQVMATLAHLEAVGHEQVVEPVAPVAHASEREEQEAATIDERLLQRLLDELMARSTEPPSVPQNTSNIRDYLDFEIVGPDAAKTQQLSELLNVMKQQVRLVRQHSRTWRAEATQRASAIEAELRAFIEAQNVEIASHMQQLVVHVSQSISTFLASASTVTHQEYDDPRAYSEVLGAQVLQLVQRFIGILEQRRILITRRHYCTTKLLVEPHVLHAQTLGCYDRAQTALLKYAARWGVRVPYYIWTGAWWSAPREPGVDADDGNDEDRILTQNLGKAEVYCSLSGEMLEKDVNDTGRPRYHCLDNAIATDRSVESMRLVRTLWGLHAMLERVAGSGAAVRMLEHSLRLLDPYRDCAWVVEKAHFWHLRESIDRETDVNTPASFISRAFTAFANRLALGMPDTTTSARASGSDAFALARAAGFGGIASAGARDSAAVELVRIDGYVWLTYRQVGQLAHRIARALRALPGVQRGDTVGISGPNSFEWACVDFACMLAGLTSVGLHTTNNNPTTAAIVNNASIAVIVAVHDRIVSGTAGDDEESESAVRWSVAGIADQCPSLLHVVAMDVSTDMARRSTANSPALQRIELHSLWDMVDPMLDAARTLQLEPPEEQPVGGTDGVVSLLYTSGSSGAPKGVICVAQSFYNDIKQRTFIEPHVTVSYIPLSHSSDRMKLWEFLGNGGRVGFAYFGASHWLAHERSKKSDMVVQAFGASSAPVRALFEQVCALRPTAMSCPPNIWNGLYGLYLDARERLHNDTLALASVAALFGDRIKFVVTGGAPTAPAIMTFIKQLLPNCSFSNSYGTTESGAILSDGKPIVDKGVAVRLDPIAQLGCLGDQQDVGPTIGTMGEICVYSPNCSPGYFKDPRRTAEAFVDNGWFKTGDVGVRLAGGRYAILGRIAAAVRLGPQGTLTFPAAAEAVFESSPLVEQLYLHVDPELPCTVAVVKPRGTSTADEVLESLRELATAGGLQPHEVPKLVLIDRETEWSEASGMLTAQLKKRQPAFVRRYATLVQQQCAAAGILVTA